MPKAATPKAAKPKVNPKASKATTPFKHKILSRKGSDPIQSIEVTLSIPNEDDECPLTLDPIKDSHVSFLPGAVFCKAKPLHSKLTLPCGHSFHSLSLLYSWCRNGMRCPCCRAGHASKADPACLPNKQVRELMEERVKQTLEEDESEEMGTLVSVTVPFVGMARNGSLILSVTFLDGPSPLFTLNSRLHEVGDNETLFRPALPTSYDILQMGATEMRLQVLISIQDMEPVVIDECGPFPIAAGTRAGINHGTRVTSFEIIMDSRLSTILWHSGGTTMDFIAIGG